MDIGTIGTTASSVHSASNVGAQVQSGQTVAATGSAPVQTANAVQQATQTPSLDQVKQAVQEINHSMNIEGRGLEFSFDEESDRTVVKVIDKQTEEVIRQIPSKEVLAISRSLEQAIGKLLKEKV